MACWGTERSRGITASDAPAACGLSKYASAVSLWEVKTGRVQRDPEGSYPVATAHGKAHESLVLAAYSAHTGARLRPAPLRWHAENGRLGATPDSLAVDRESGEERLVEVKCPLWAEWPEYVPPEVLAQVQMQLEVYDLPACDLCAYFHRLRLLRVWRVYRSRAYWSWMQQRLAAFLEAVDADRPPSIASVYEAADVLARSSYDYARLAGPDAAAPRKAFPPRAHCVRLFDLADWAPGAACAEEPAVAEPFVDRELRRAVAMFAFALVCLGVVILSVY
eukprot:m51a1_g1174 putative C-tail anchored (278) ;mRNA; r:380845-381757